MTDVYEGSLIRLFRRLEELLRQMGQAAKVMGNTDLEKKFEESLNKIRRDIVVCFGAFRNPIQLELTYSEGCTKLVSLSDLLRHMHV